MLRRRHNARIDIVDPTRRPSASFLAFPPKPATAGHHRRPRTSPAREQRAQLSTPRHRHRCCPGVPFLCHASESWGAQHVISIVRVFAPPSSLTALWSARQASLPVPTANRACRWNRPDKAADGHPQPIWRRVRRPTLFETVS